MFSGLFGACFVLERILANIVTGRHDRDGWSKVGRFVFAALMTCVIANMDMMPGRWFIRWSRLIDPLGNPFQREQDVPNALDPERSLGGTRSTMAPHAGGSRPDGVLGRRWRELSDRQEIRIGRASKSSPELATVAISKPRPGVGNAGASSKRQVIGANGAAAGSVCSLRFPRGVDCHRAFGLRRSENPDGCATLPNRKRICPPTTHCFLAFLGSPGEGRSRNSMCE